MAGLGSQEWGVLCLFLRVFRGVVPRLMELFRVAEFPSWFPLNKLFQVGALNAEFGGDAGDWYLKRRQILVSCKRPLTDPGRL